MPTIDQPSVHHQNAELTKPLVAMAAPSRRSISMESIPNIANHNSHVHPIVESAQSINMIANKYGTVGGYSVMKSDYVNAEPGELNTQGSQRFRSINRSFRTAVDKSFDMPNLSGKF